MDKKLINTLLDLGLTENEARIYLAAIALGPTTILKIAKEADIKRTTVYSVVESLKQKGLISIEMKGWKKLFTAESPEKLELILEEKRKKLRDNLHNLLSLYNVDAKESLIKYYEGLPAVKTVYEELLRKIRPREDYLVIGSQEWWYNLDPDYFQKFIERRAKLPINIRLLFQDSALARKHQKFEKNYNEKIKILPKGTKLSTNMVIIPHMVVIHQLTPPIIAIVIKNKNVIQMQKEMFEIIWDSLV